PLSHLGMVGIDIARVRTTEDRGIGFLPSLFNLYDPVYGSFEEPVPESLPTVRTEWTGYYLQDQIRFGDLIGIFGVRFDDVTNESSGTTQDDDAVSFRAGLLYHFPLGVAPYASYSESFDPVIGVDLEGRPYQPIRGRQFEI